jgi:hypothetical protein
MKTIKEPNPLNFFNVRKVNILPPHFEVVVQPMMYNLEDSVGRWIKTHLKGRYFVGKGVALQNSSIETVYKIGFEDPKEASYFMLACPHLKYN